MHFGDDLTSVSDLFLGGPSNKSGESPEGKVPRHMESSMDKPEPAARKVHQPHLETHIGDPNAEVSHYRKRPNPQMEVTMGSDNGEVASSSARSPRPSMETTYDKEERLSPSMRNQRISMETTYNKPLQPSPSKPKPDMQSQIFSDGQVTEEKRHIKYHPDRLKSNISFSDDGSEPSQHSPKSNNYSKSSVFEDNPPFPEVKTKRTYVGLSGNASNVQFGDDGGTTGMPNEAPKWVTTSSTKRPPSSRYLQINILYFFLEWGTKFYAL
jgi:hypothetical protein